MQKTVLFLLLVSVSILLAEEFYQQGKKVTVTPMVAAPSSLTAGVVGAPSPSYVQWYRTEEGNPIGVLPQILIQWRNPSLKEQVLQNYPIITQEDLTKTITLITLENGADVFLVSRQLYEDSATKSAHPNFIKEKVYR